MGLLYVRESTKSMPPKLAFKVACKLAEYKKRTRAQDDGIILTQKRLRKGPGFYTKLADCAPVDQDMAGECFAYDLDHIRILRPHLSDMLRQVQAQLLPWEATSS